VCSLSCVSRLPCIISQHLARVVASQLPWRCFSSVLVPFKPAYASACRCSTDSAEAGVHVAAYIVECLCMRCSMLS
jgi:hypothetical protein